MAYTLSDILNAFMTAVQDVLGNIATAIADNAGIIASIVVLGGLTMVIVRYGTNIFRRMTAWLGALF